MEPILLGGPTTLQGTIERLPAWKFRIISSISLLRIIHTNACMAKLASGQVGMTKRAQQ